MDARFPSFILLVENGTDNTIFEIFQPHASRNYSIHNETCCHQITGFQKIYDFYGLKHNKTEKDMISRLINIEHFQIFVQVLFSSDDF